MISIHKFFERIMVSDFFFLFRFVRKKKKKKKKKEKEKENLLGLPDVLVAINKREHLNGKENNIMLRTKEEEDLRREM